MRAWRRRLSLETVGLQVLFDLSLERTQVCVLTLVVPNLFANHRVLRSSGCPPWAAAGKSITQEAR